MILRDFRESFQIPVSILFDLDQDLQEAGHGPGLDGVAVAAELTLGIGQLRNAAPLGRLDLDEVSREHRHHELLGLSPLLVATDLYKTSAFRPHDRTTSLIRCAPAKF